MDQQVSWCGPPPTPHERLADLRSIWPEVDVWCDAAPLLTVDLGRLAPRSGPSLRPDGDKHIAKAKANGDWGALSSEIALKDGDTRLDPARPRTWETDETLKLPVTGPLFLFGQLGASSPAVERQQLKWLGRTGVGVKLKPWLLEEVQVRGGPAVRYDDTNLSQGQSAERSELFFEAATKVPLPVIGPLNVEYTGFAVPPATAADRGFVNQDVRFAKPLRGGSEVHVGAKYRWEDTPSATPWVDRMQLYMGVQLKR